MQKKEEEEEEEEEVKMFFRGAKRNRGIAYSFSPEPVQKKKRKKKVNPNKRDKAGRTKLFYFTSQGNLDKVQEWVQDGAEVSAKDNAGWTVLHEAALKGQDGIMRFLIACGADVNARGFGGDTPLHDACSNGEMACIRSLLENGADVFALNEAEERPVDVCEDRQCRWLLLDRMKQLEQDLACQLGRRSLLHQACLDGCEQATRRCLEQGADVNGKDEKAWTPLHLACAGGKGTIVKILVEQGGALVNILGSDAMDSPLHQASKEGHTDLVRYLLKIRTLDIYLKNRQGLTAYDVCAHYPAIRQLLTARMDELRLLQTTSHALDPIAQKTAHRNASRQQLSREERKIQHVMRVFANLEEEPEKLTVRRRPRRRPISHSPPKPTDPLRGLKKDASGRTELHRAASAGNGDKLHTLLARGVDPNPRDHAGYSPLHEASLRGHTRAVRLLLEHGADVHAQGGPDEDTALHDATENGHGAVIQLLLDHGAHPLQTNRQGKHPLHLALHTPLQALFRPKTERDDPHSPIPTPPPEPCTHSLYLAPASDAAHYVLDSQLALVLGHQDGFWKHYPHLPRRALPLHHGWPRLRTHASFLIRQDHALRLLKNKFPSILTVRWVPLDIGFQANKLPLKLVWKSKYRFHSE